MAMAVQAGATTLSSADAATLLTLLERKAELLLPRRRWTRDRPIARRWATSAQTAAAAAAAAAAASGATRAVGGAPAARRGGSGACSAMSQVAITVACLQGNPLIAQQFASMHGKLHRWWRDDVYEKGRRALKRQRYDDAERQLRVALFLQRMPAAIAQSSDATQLAGATLDTIEALGEVLYHQKRQSEALVQLRQAVAARQAMPDGGGVALAKTRESLARVYAALTDVPHLVELVGRMGNATSEASASRSRVIGLTARLAKRDLNATVRERWDGDLVSRVARHRRVQSTPPPCYQRRCGVGLSRFSSNARREYTITLLLNTTTLQIHIWGRCACWFLANCHAMLLLSRLL
jgi:hypothetical protein